MPTHAENRQARRKRLMTEARQLYAQQGVENTSMEDVARAADCTRRTLYAYFSSWENLLLEIYIESLAERWRWQQEAMAGSVTGLEKLRSWADSYFGYAKAHPEVLHMEMFRDYRGLEPDGHAAGFQKDYQAVLKPLTETMVQIFELGKMDGTVREELSALPTLSQFAFSLRSLMNRVLSSGDSPDEFETDGFVESFIDLFLRGLSPSPEARS